MAQVTTVELVDDLTGDKADETVTFGLDGTSYDIDLSSNNAGVLRDVLGDYVEHGRKVAGKASVTRRGSDGDSQRANREMMQRIREWARQAGKQVSDRGRIPSEIKNAFEQAHRSLASVG